MKSQEKEIPLDDINKSANLKNITYLDENKDAEKGKKKEAFNGGDKDQDTQEVKSDIIIIG